MGWIGRFYWQVVLKALVNLRDLRSWEFLSLLMQAPHTGLKHKFCICGAFPPYYRVPPGVRGTAYWAVFRRHTFTQRNTLCSRLTAAILAVPDRGTDPRTFRCRIDTAATYCVIFLPCFAIVLLRQTLNF